MVEMDMVKQEQEPQVKQKIVEQKPDVKKEIGELKPEIKPEFSEEKPDIKPEFCTCCEDSKSDSTNYERVVCDVCDTNPFLKQRLDHINESLGLSVK